MVTLVTLLLCTKGHHCLTEGFLSGYPGNFTAMYTRISLSNRGIPERLPWKFYWEVHKDIVVLSSRGIPEVVTLVTLLRVTKGYRYLAEGFMGGYPGNWTGRYTRTSLSNRGNSEAVTLVTLLLCTKGHRCLTEGFLSGYPGNSTAMYKRTSLSNRGISGRLPW